MTLILLFMEPADVTFSKITSVASSQYFVPKWQRPYSWDKQEWGDLWKDIMNLDELTANGKQHSHFIGTMVLKNTVNKVGKDLEYAIVDGQQRFCTLLVLCSAIRDIAKENDDQSLADRINNGFLFFPSEEGGMKPRLVMQDEDNVEFKNLISKYNGDLSSNLKISRAYRYFYKKLEDKHERLKRIFSLIGGLKLITISLNDTDDQNRIFETLNSRGKDLKQTDLIRNFFIMRLPSVKDQEEMYLNFWRPLEKLIEKKKNAVFDYDTDSFFEDYVTLIRQTSVKQDLVYSVIKEHYGMKESSEEMMDEVKEIYFYATVYEKMLDPEKEEDEQIRLKLHNLNNSGVFTYYPLLLKLLYSYHIKNTIKKDDLLNSLNSLESFIFRRIYCGIATNSLNKYFPTLINLEPPDIGMKLTEKLKGGKQSLIWPDLQTFVKGVSEFEVYHRNKDVAKFTLELLERNHKMYEPLDFSKLEIEHIMPETLNENWASQLGSDANQIHDRYVDTLANLTLITRGKNASISQDTFEIKKEKWYRFSGVKLTNDVVKNFEKWGKNDIEKRSAFLIQTLTRIWPHPNDTKSKREEQKNEQ